MSQSLSIGKIRGITLRLHWSWLLLAGVLVLADSPLLLYLVALMPIVLLHELGHSLVAQRLGLRVLDITFWPLGGFARMTRIPEDGRIEGLVAAAGPAVNLALALLLWPLTLIGGPVGRACGILALVNLLLGATNLLPAFPLDGGRVLRALLGLRADWVRATERAVAVGKVVALLTVVGGLATSNLFLALFGLFFWMSGAQELFAVRLRHGVPPFGAAVFGRDAGAGVDLGELFRRAAETGGAAGGPRVDGAPREAGTAADAAAAPGDGAPPGEDAHAARRPQPASSSANPGAGFSDEEIARLERFPGSLRQLRRDPSEP